MTIDRPDSRWQRRQIDAYGQQQGNLIAAMVSIAVAIVSLIFHVFGLLLTKEGQR